jgi:hypothetical protein
VKETRKTKKRKGNGPTIYLLGQKELGRGNGVENRHLCANKTTLLKEKEGQPIIAGQ